MFHDFVSYSRYLLGSLAQSEDNLGEALTQLALVVDPCKSKVLQRPGLE